jgi:hypothetical protein
MKTRTPLFVAVLLAALFCLPANAQPSPPPAGSDNASTSSPGTIQSSPRDRMQGPRDCSQSRNPTACTARREARDKAMAACKDITGPQRRQCMQTQMLNIDCSKSGNPQRCEARKTAGEACQGQSGRAFRQCMQEKMPPMDCRQAPNQQRCEQHEKARAACQDKLGQEHLACLRQQFGGK